MDMPFTVACPSSRTTPSKRVATSARCAVAASSSWARRARAVVEQHDVALGLGQAVGDGGAGLGHLLGLVEGGRARHLERGQAPHGVVGRLVEGRRGRPGGRGSRPSRTCSAGWRRPGPGRRAGPGAARGWWPPAGSSSTEAWAVASTASAWASAAWSWVTWVSRPASSPRDLVDLRPRRRRRAACAAARPTAERGGDPDDQHGQRRPLRPPRHVARFRSLPGSLR